MVKGKKVEKKPYVFEGLCLRGIELMQSTNSVDMDYLRIRFGYGSDNVDTAYEVSKFISRNASVREVQRDLLALSTILDLNIELYQVKHVVTADMHIG